MRNLFAFVSLATAALTGEMVAAAPAEAWQIGPVIRGRNYSVGMPATLQPGPDGPWFAFPPAGEGHVHYISLVTGPLQGAKRITLRYRIDASRDTRFVAQESQSTGKVGLALHRTGDNWSARGRYEAYRWYSPIFVPIKPGINTLSVSLDDPAWGAVMTSTGRTNPKAFAETLANTEAVSVTFGGDGGRGHGVYATKSARFTILDFRVD
jgi:hypothetical protein